MITYWQQEDGLFIRREKNEIDSSQRLWVDAVNVTVREMTILEEKYNLDHDHVLDSLDPDELSRIEAADDYILTILRLPVFRPNAEVCYFTTPIGIMIFPAMIITLCWTDCEVLLDLRRNRIRDITLNDFPALITKVLSRADMMFLRYLKEINRRTNSIQLELQKSVENRELIQLFNMEKSLTYFTTSLKSNQLLLERMRKTRLLKLDAEDQDWLDDVEIENKQAMEMADTYSAITSGTMDAFASVITNNMNIVMQKLTVFSIVLMVISFITSFWGMNIKLPWSGGNTWTGFIFLSLFCLVTAIVSFIVMTVSPFNIIRKIKDRRSPK